MDILRKFFPSYYVDKSGSDNKYITFPLKVVINKEKTRVLFAEVGTGFVDLLFSFLILPMAIILQVLEKHYGEKTPHVIGSLNTLYNSLSNLTRFHLLSEGYKPPILNMECAYAFPHDNVQFEFSKHETRYYLRGGYFVVYPVFSRVNASFIICDDLRIVPNVNGSIVQTLNNIGIDMADMDGSQTRNVTLGFNEVMDFLKGLLISSQPLTDIILGTSANLGSNKVLDFLKDLLFLRQPPGLQISKSGIPLNQIKKESSPNSKNMILKAMFQKSTKKFLFAQAERDFVEFLFLFLDTPLGLIDLYFGSNTSFIKLGFFYKSIAKLISTEYLNSPYTKDCLMNPDNFSSCFLHLLVDENLYGNRPTMYMVTDDLIVTPLKATSAFSFLDKMKISSSDVEEVELHIGLKEARKILKASLTSSCAISDGLITPILKKQQKLPEQEH